MIQTNRTRDVYPHNSRCQNCTKQFVGPGTFQAGLELDEVSGPSGCYLTQLKFGHCWHWKQRYPNILSLFMAIWIYHWLLICHLNQTYFWKNAGDIEALTKIPFWLSDWWVWKCFWLFELSFIICLEVNTIYGKIDLGQKVCCVHLRNG